MRKRFALFLTLLPLTFGLAAPEPQQFSRRLPDNEIAIEDLAYFFFHNAALSEANSLYSEVLRRLISEGGINRLEPELAELKREANDTSKHLANARQTCSELRRAASGKEFGAVLVKLDEKQYRDQRQAGGRILSKLDTEDRQALETYLDTDYRAGFARTTTDFAAFFGSQPFPSAETKRLIRRSCDEALEGEASVRQ